MPNKKLDIKKSNPFLLFTILFMLFYIPVVQVYFWRSNTSYIWGYDGLRQHFPYFVYIGQFIRDSIKNLEIRSFDYSMGMGGDVLVNTVGGMVLDPFNWLSALVPAKYAEILYNLIIYLKMYLSGLTFILLSREEGHKRFSSVAGALVYSLSAGIFIGFKQSFFLVPFYVFPLLIAGFLRLWKNKDSKLYFVALAFFSIESFYFTYMAGIMVAILFVVKTIESRKNGEKDSILKKIYSYIVPTILALLTGIGINLPIIMNLYSTDRLNVERTISVFYPAKQCAAMFAYYFGAYDTEIDAIVGVSAFFLISVVFLFTQKGRYFSLKTLWIIGTISLFIPAVGSVFNGFNYACDRFIFGYVLLLAIIVAQVFEDINEISSKANKILLSVAFVLCISYALIGIFAELDSFFIPVLSIILTVGIFEAGRRYIKETDKKILVNFVAVFLSLCLGGLQFLSYLADEELKTGNMNQIIKSYKEKKYDSNYRTDYLKFMYFESNMAMLSGNNSYDFYSSYYNNDVNNYLVNLAFPGTTYSSQYSSLYGRTYLEILNGTRYLCVDDSYSNYLPYGYNSELNSSIVYFVNNKYSPDKFSSLNAFEREELMMRGISVEGGSSDINIPDYSVDFELIPGEGMTLENNKITVTNPESTLTLKTTGLTEGECSILIENLSGTGGNVIAGILDGKRHLTSCYFAYLNKESVTFTGDRSWMVNTGFGDCSTNTFYITFPEGVHSFDSIKLYVRDENSLKDTLNEFYSNAKIENVEYSLKTDRIDIKTNNDSDSTIYIAIPYSSGWTLWVDGVETEIYKANNCFIAADISSGEHTLVMKYQTPYLGVGVAISLSAITLGVVYLNVEKRKRKKA